MLWFSSHEGSVTMNAMSESTWLADAEEGRAHDKLQQEAHEQPGINQNEAEDVTLTSSESADAGPVDRPEVQNPATRLMWWHHVMRSQQTFC